MDCRDDTPTCYPPVPPCPVVPPCYPTDYSSFPTPPPPGVTDTPAAITRDPKEFYRLAFNTKYDIKEETSQSNYNYLFSLNKL